MMVKILRHLALAAILIVVLFPIYWTVSGSLKYVRDIVTAEPKFLFTPTLDNYRDLLAISDMRKGLVSSLIVVILTIAVSLVVGIPASYSLARFKFRLKENVRFWLLSLRMLPPVAVAIPFMTMWLKLRIYDTYIGLILAYLLVSLPIVMWLAIDSFKTVPTELEEAAMVEGCTQWQVFFRIALPLAASSFMGALLFAFILIWNEFFLAFVLTSRRMTMPVTAASFAMVGMEIPWGLVCASVCLLSVPPLILAFFFKRFLQAYFVPKI